MNAEEARARYRANRTGRTKAQKMGDVVRRARAEARFEHALDLSNHGLSKEEVAHRLGMTKEGLENMLRRKLGTSVWPIGQ